MESKDYLKAIQNHLGEDDKAECQDCDTKSMLSHAVIDYDRNKVKVVCDDCFRANYLDWLYGKPRVH